MTEFSIINPDYVYKIDGIASLGQGFAFTGLNTSGNVYKQIKIIGASTSGLRNYNITWPSSVPSATQLLSVGSTSYNSNGDLQTVTLDWSNSTPEVFTQSGSNLYNTSVGAPVGNNNFIAGVGASPTLNGNQCVVIGSQAGSTFLGDDNIIIGFQAMNSVQGFVAGSNYSNIAIGSSSLMNASAVLGNQNIRNIAIGDDSGLNITTGSNNIFIGYNTTGSIGTASNQIVIGNNGVGKGNNTVLLGNTLTTDVYIGQNSAGAPKNLVLIGDDASGTDFNFKLRAPTNASFNSNRELILPSAVPTAGQALTVSSVAAGPPNIATLTWSTVIPPQYFQAYVNTYLRITGATGNWVRLSNYAGTTTPLTVATTTSQFALSVNSGFIYTGPAAVVRITYNLALSGVSSGVTVAIGPGTPLPTEAYNSSRASIREMTYRSDVGDGMGVCNSFFATMNTNDSALLYGYQVTVGGVQDVVSGTITGQVMWYT